ncbi:MAG: response regulator [Oribacterium sp.]|nr:response regulator [Oribacterium sp.]
MIVCKPPDYFALTVDHTTIYSQICKKLGADEEPKDISNKRNGKKKILVVDDNGSTLRTIKTMLEDRYDVQIAPSGMKAMTSMGRSKPDLIVLDLNYSRRHRFKYKCLQSVV